MKKISNINYYCNDIKMTSLKQITNIIQNTITDYNESNKIDSNLNPIVDYVATLCKNISDMGVFHLIEFQKCTKYLELILKNTENLKPLTEVIMSEIEKLIPKKEKILDIPEGEGEILCNVEFKLAYGGKILLNTTNFHVRRGRIYGLLGHNGCGKSTLMRAISNGALAGFPGADELMKLRACFVDHDIDGSDANISTIDFCMKDPILASIGKNEIYKKLIDMEFTEDLIAKPICNLSGGWKMKLALARAMLLKADLLLLDEPTNHLDVQKQKWLCDFLTGPQCENVTTLVVSHDSKFLNNVLTDVIHYENMKLKRYTGNLTSFVEQCPIGKAYFSIHDTEMKFKFPEPTQLEGVRSKTKAIIKAVNISFTYPGSNQPTFQNVSCQLSQASRVACIGPNGAGKSTLIKVLVGETKPDGQKEIYKHPNCRFAYLAQHAFHHVEKHLEKSPVQYIQWRFSGGLDKEQEELEASQMTQEEIDKINRTFVIYLRETSAEKDSAGNLIGEKEKVFDKMRPLENGEKVELDPSIGIFENYDRKIKTLISRRTRHGQDEYEVKWNFKNTALNSNDKYNLYVPKVVLEKFGFNKMMKKVDDRIAAEAGQMKPLTQGNIQKHLDDFGLAEEFGTYGKISNLSGGQKVKCVLAASMWFRPHLVVLDEPTNYLDRDSLGALSSAIKDFAGGVLLISHNSEFFEGIAPEIWNVPGDKTVQISGSDYLEAIKKKELAEQKKKKNGIPAQNEQEFDSLGNLVKKEKPLVDFDRKYLKNLQKQYKSLKQRLEKGDTTVEDEMYDLEEKILEAKKYLDNEKEIQKKNKKSKK